MGNDWQNDYDTRFGVDPSDYADQDDFLSARMSARGDFNPQGQKKEGCYIATCVYGSYDCPEVVALRDFRDSALEPTRFGRAFIRCYYALSPKLVALLGEKRLFKKLCKKPLNAMVAHLEGKTR